MALCADAVLDGEGLIGDPTEGALIVLAGKGGLDLDATRTQHPRVAEVPFDSEYKFMATFHEMTDTEGRPVVRCYVKGAPDVLIDRGGSYRSPDGAVVPISDDNRNFALEANDRMAEAGERVMVVAQRGVRPGHLRERPIRRRRPDRPGHRPDAVGHGRHRRPAPARGEGGDRRVPQRRDPGADDHRRPRHHGRRHRGRAGDRGTRPHRHRVRRDERRRAAPRPAEHRRGRPGGARGQDPAGPAAQALRATSSR